MRDPRSRCWPRGKITIWLICFRFDFEEKEIDEIRALKEIEKQDITGNENVAAQNLGLFPLIGKIHMTYQITMLIVKSYYAFVVTYRLAFEAIDGTEKLYWVIIDSLTDLIFLIDIAIHFNRPYYDENNVL